MNWEDKMLQVMVGMEHHFPHLDRREVTAVVLKTRRHIGCKGHLIFMHENTIYHRRIKDGRMITGRIYYNEGSPRYRAARAFLSYLNLTRT